MVRVFLIVYCYWLFATVVPTKNIYNSDFYMFKDKSLIIKDLSIFTFFI